MEKEKEKWKKLEKIVKSKIIKNNISARLNLNIVSAVSATHYLVSLIIWLSEEKRNYVLE